MLSQNLIYDKNKALVVISYRILRMKRVYHKAKNHQEAEDWDIFQQINMTHEERQAIAKELRKKAYGRKPIDVRKAHSRK